MSERHISPCKGTLMFHILLSFLLCIHVHTCAYINKSKSNNIKAGFHLSVLQRERERNRKSGHDRQEKLVSTQKARRNWLLEEKNNCKQIWRF